MDRCGSPNTPDVRPRLFVGAIGGLVGGFGVGVGCFVVGIREGAIVGLAVGLAVGGRVVGRKFILESSELVLFGQSDHLRVSKAQL